MPKKGLDPLSVVSFIHLHTDPFDRNSGIVWTQAPMDADAFIGTFRKRVLRLERKRKDVRGSNCIALSITDGNVVCTIEQSLSSGSEQLTNLLYCLYSRVMEQCNGIDIVRLPLAAAHQEEAVLCPLRELDTSC